MAKHMTDPNSTPTHEQIARRAYEIFIERGQPENQDLAHWLEAERQLRAASQNQAKSSSAQIASKPATPSTPAATSAPIRATTPAQSNGRSNGRSKAPAAARK
jgi:hypothetical protein